MVYISPASMVISFQFQNFAARKTSRKDTFLEKELLVIQIWGEIYTCNILRILTIDITNGCKRKRKTFLDKIILVFFSTNWDVYCPA